MVAYKSPESVSYCSAPTDDFVAGEALGTGCLTFMWKTQYSPIPTGAQFLTENVVSTLQKRAITSLP